MINKRILLLTLACGLSVSALADHHESAKSAPADETASLFVSSFLGNYDYTTNHIVQLAEAIPADRYDWSPATGVRSVEKAILHVAAANYMLGSKLGAALPDGLDPMAIEAKDHDKPAAIKTLKDSIAFARGAVAALSADDHAAQVDLFGMQLNKMSVALIVGGHANEHLGQLIAYARSIGVTPPWSQ